MNYEIDRQPRKRLRMHRNEYTNFGYYFVTICVNQRECLFGEIVNRELRLNSAGVMVNKCLSSISDLYQGWHTDTQIVMPNHIHAIFHLFDSSISLTELMRNIKSFTTVCYIKGVLEHNWQPFNKKLWQRSYNDHIIRNQRSLSIIRRYIINNPKMWNP